MYFVYSLLAAVAALALFPYLLLRNIFGGKQLANVRQRFGFYPAGQFGGDTAYVGQTIWLHAVSVGELLAAVPLAQKIKERFPRHRLVISTTTATGQRIARERMEFADGVFYFPLDWAGAVRRALRFVRPAAVVIMETEIWPNFLHECRNASIPVIFANGRMSQKSANGFVRTVSLSGGLLQSFLRRILNDAALYLMQTEEDAARIVALGAAPGKVIVAGNLKYDLSAAAESPLALWLAGAFQKANRKPVLVAGSVVAGEEGLVLQAFANVLNQFPGALLILAPRKPERFAAAARIIQEAGHEVVRRRSLGMDGKYQNILASKRSVLLLDSLGELAGVYGIADAVFVGGSLVPSGGHNILEPGACSKVPIFGPYMENFREMAATFLRANAAIQVNRWEELAAAWLQLLTDPERANAMGSAAQSVVEKNRGATERVLQHLIQVVDSHAASEHA